MWTLMTLWDSTNLKMTEVCWKYRHVVNCELYEGRETFFGHFQQTLLACNKYIYQFLQFSYARQPSATSDVGYRSRR